MEIKKDTSLKNYNTFGIDVTADFMTEIFSLQNLKQILRDDQFVNCRKLILGGGSNVLFTGHIAGLVLLNRLSGIEVLREDDQDVYIKAGSGVVWHELVMWCIHKGYGGIENLSLIPGSVGAGPMQNIGAYGVELKDVFYELEAMDLHSLETIKFNKASCRFAYRESIFKHELKDRYYILSVTLRLSKSPQIRTEYGAIKLELTNACINNPGIVDVSNAVIAIRRSKLPDPATLGNAGSFFKNPEIEFDHFVTLKSEYPDVPGYLVEHNRYKIPAGWLIEQCGWKGKKVGNTGSHVSQALVLVNYGGATGSEVYALAIQIIESVKQKFAIDLQTEVNIIPS